MTAIVGPDGQELKQLVKNKDQAIAEASKKDDFKLIGIFKMKDKKGRDTVAFQIHPDMEGVVIHKVRGESSKIVVAVKIAKPLKREEKKNDKKSKT